MRKAAMSLLCALVIGCGAASGVAPQANVEVMRREQTPDKLLERGLAFAGIGDLTRAEQYLVAALDQGAPPRRVVPTLLKVCIAASRHRAAIVYAREYGSKLSSDSQFQFILALLEAGLGESESAIAHLRSTVAGTPQHADAHFLLAELLQQQGRTDDDQVESHLREYLRLAPDGPRAEEARSALKLHCTMPDCPP